MADFDGDGGDEVVIGFGTAGVWKNDNGVWSQVHPFSATALVASIH